MSLENSINDLNTSIQALIALMSAQSAPVTKPKAVKAAKPAAVKQAEPTAPVATVEAATEDNFPTLEEVINEMRVIEDREILTKIMNSFKVTRASDIAEEKRPAFIEALQLELQKGAA
tara:strand:- start:635 stop:988 length:354 start_codon:yes stop_codon:yes gene_type:complete